MFREIAENKYEGVGAHDLDDETKASATKAANLMEALEKCSPAIQHF
jgi:hypothetical protein